MANFHFNKNYILGIDVKTLLLKDRLPKVGKSYSGKFFMSDEYSATFVERIESPEVRRNVRVYDGEHVTMTYRPEDDFFRLNFKSTRFAPGFDVDSYAIEVMEEVREALKGFV